MNWFYFTVMGYIIASALRGFHKGFIRVIYSVAALVATVVFIAITMPMFRGLILDSTTIRQQIQTGSEKYVRKQIEKKLEEGTLPENIDLSWVTLPKKYQKDFQKKLKQTKQSAIPDFLESQGIYKKMAETVSDICVTVIAFFISFIIIAIILYLVGRKLDIFSRKPGIHLINMIFGFFAGIVKAFLVIWIVFWMIEMTKIFPSSASLLHQIQANAALSGLYERNLVKELIMSFL